MTVTIILYLLQDLNIIVATLNIVYLSINQTLISDLLAKKLSIPQMYIGPPADNVIIWLRNHHTTILLPVVPDDSGGAGDPVLAASESVKRIQLLFMPLH